MAFSHALTRRDDQLVANVRNEGLQVWCNFVNGIGRAVAGDDEDLSEIVIEEDRHIVPAGQLIVLPRTVNRFGAKHLEAGAIDVGKYVKDTFVIANAGRPDSTAVNVPAFETIGR